MSGNPQAKHTDGGRQRCQNCGHPRKEHRSGLCTVPKCDCSDFEPRPTRR